MTTPALCIRLSDRPCRPFARLSQALLALFLTTQVSHATPEAWSSVTDKLLWVAEDRYVVMRQTELGYASYYQRRTSYDRVEISVWNGRVLSRCSLGVQDARDDTAEGDWRVTHTPPDAGCSAAPGPDMSHPVPVLHPGVTVTLVEGALTVKRDGRAPSILAEADYVSAHLRAMLGDELAACAGQPQDWPMFGGCFLAEDVPACGVHPVVWGTPDRVFVQLLCDDPDRAFTDLDASRTWLAVGRLYWDAQTE